jgi:hypothetical protein
MNTRSFILSALIAGALIGFFGNLPLLNLINCILCLWVWLGGILAVYLYRRYQRGGPGLSIAQGAGLGALSGLIGALVGTVVFAITNSLSMPLFNSLARALQIEGDLPLQSGDIGTFIAQVIFFLIIDLVLYPIFGAIGGLLAAGVFWKEPQTS